MENTCKAQLNVGLFFYTVLASVAISIWSVYADPIINIDGILYLQAADAFTRGDFEQAIASHKWPLYPFLISLIHQITSLELEFSAHVLNCILNALACIAFLLLIREIGANSATVAIAALIIVFFPGLNELRSYIIRDHGYIAFYLLSLYYLVRALHVRSRCFLLFSMIAMSIATLFRIEGSVFLIAMPIIYLNSRVNFEPMNRILFYSLILTTTLMLAALFGWWLHVPNINIGNLNFSYENILLGWSQAGQFLDEKIEILKEYIIDSSSDTTGRLVYIWTVFGIIFAQVLIILSIPYAYLVWYGNSRNLIFPETHSVRPWKLFILFNLIILIVFTLTKFFLTDRYPLALAVTLLCVVPFALNQIYERWQAKPRKTIKSNLGYIFVVLLLLVNIYEGLTSITNKHYLKDAGNWIEQNVSDEMLLYTNNLLIGFYSGAGKDKLFVEPSVRDLINQFYRGEWINFDYLALEVKPDPEFLGHLEKTLWVVPAQVIKGERDREVRIYNIKKYRERPNQ